MTKVFVVDRHFECTLTIKSDSEERSDIKNWIAL